MPTKVSTTANGTKPRKVKRSAAHQARLLKAYNDGYRSKRRSLTHVTKGKISSKCMLHSKSSEKKKERAEKAEERFALMQPACVHSRLLFLLLPYTHCSSR